MLHIKSNKIKKLAKLKPILMKFLKIVENKSLKSKIEVLRVLIKITTKEITIIETLKAIISRSMDTMVENIILIRNIIIKKYKTKIMIIQMFN